MLRIEHHLDVQAVVNEQQRAIGRTDKLRRIARFYVIARVDFRPRFRQRHRRIEKRLGACDHLRAALRVVPPRLRHPRQRIRPVERIV